MVLINNVFLNEVIEKIKRSQITQKFCEFCGKYLTDYCQCLLVKVILLCIDPHVRVAGRPDDVRLAREKIMRLLDTRVK